MRKSVTNFSLLVTFLSALFSAATLAALPSVAPTTAPAIDALLRESLDRIPQKAPDGFDEGTDIVVPAADLADLRKWANDSKLALLDLLERTSHESPALQLHDLTVGIDEVVKQSVALSRGRELFMRYSLNRSRRLLQILQNYLDPQSVGSVDIEIRWLRTSISQAVKHYKSDLEWIDGHLNRVDTMTEPPNYAEFGMDFAQFAFEFNESLVHAKAQFDVGCVVLSLLEWDFNRDRNRYSLAPSIVGLHDFLADLVPVGPQNSVLAVEQTRKLRWAYNRYTSLALQSDPQLAKFAEQRSQTLAKRKESAGGLDLRQALPPCDRQVLPVCVGDLVYTSDNSEGKAVALHPIPSALQYSTIAIEVTQLTGSQRYKVGEVTTQRLENITYTHIECDRKKFPVCLGDSAYTSDNNLGKVVAMHPIPSALEYSLIAIEITKVTGAQKHSVGQVMTERLENIKYTH